MPIADFHCTYDNSAGINADVTRRLNLKFPDAYKHWDTMVMLSKALKDHDHVTFCLLPFCHTVEAEAMGGIINLGDETAGPRAKEYVCTTAEDILALPEIDYSNGRIGEVLKACTALIDEGEQVILEISGPFTILNVLIDARNVFRIFRKKPEQMRKIFAKLEEELLRYIREAEKAGVNMLSFADSSGGLNILGPKIMEQYVKIFTYPFLREVEKRTTDGTLVLLCPKTAFSLIGTGKALWKNIDLGEPMRYGDACISCVGKTKYLGEMCINNTQFVLKDGVVKALVLV
jgi:uroporphyrinogen-III decarboxylase